MDWGYYNTVLQNKQTYFTFHVNLLSLFNKLGVST